MIWRVIWPLIVLLAAPIFGLLYKALTRFWALPSKGNLSVIPSALSRKTGMFAFVALAGELPANQARADRRRT